MRTEEIRKQVDEDLVKKIAELKKELFDLRFQLAVGQLENTSSIGRVKNEIAQVKTIQRERELSNQEVIEDGKK
ncbi:MAG: 50S ribosomal protein L29 [Acholeplasmatales bacterium]|jgi:large subunit ribosomal protein L29|nr:50S ribosomal protein L29 [Acholeplasmatales bacterium]